MTEECGAELGLQLAVLFISLFSESLYLLWKKFRGHAAKVALAVSIDKKTREGILAARVEKKKEEEEKRTVQVQGSFLNPISGASAKAGELAAEAQAKANVLAAEARSVRSAVHQGKFGFLVPIREEKSLIDGSYQPPAPCTSVRFRHRSALHDMLYVLTGDLVHTLQNCFNLVLIMSIFHTVGIMMRISDEDSAWRDFYDEIVANLPSDSFVSEIKYLPTFMIAFAVNNASSRWQSMFGYATSIQGRIHDMGLILAGAFPISRESDATKATFYRYITTAHYLNYFGLDPRVSSDPDQVCKDLVDAKLLTEDEAAALRPAHPGMRDYMMAMISVLFQTQVQAGIISDSFNHFFTEKLCAMRGHMGALRDLYDMYPSLTHLSMLSITTKIMMVAIVLKYTAESFVVEQDECMPHATNISVFFVAFGYMGMLAIIKILDKGPFGSRGDLVNMDALLCLSDRVLYRSLRASSAVQSLNAFEQSVQREVAI